MPKLINVADMIHDEVERAFKDEGYVKVIRCKDCDQFDIDDMAIGRLKGFCYQHGECVMPNYYCASAERRKK